MPNLVLHLNHVESPPSHPTVERLRRRCSPAMVEAGLRSGFYVAVATFEGDDLDKVYEATQNIHSSWSTKPADGIVPLGDGKLRPRGHRSTDLGDLLLVDGRPYVVMPEGFDFLGDVSLPEKVPVAGGSVMALDHADALSDGQVVSRSPLEPADYLSNRLTVEGEPDQIWSAKKLLLVGARSPSEMVGFERVAPLPEHLPYETATRNSWGCEGGALVAKVVVDDHLRFSVTFDTAGNAPFLVAQALSYRVPGAVVSLDTVWTAEPETAASGCWISGTGRMDRVRGGPGDYLWVKPGTPMEELEDLFPVPGAPTP